MRYGHFDDDRREYVITRPDTPVPWINYLGTDEFFGIISNTAGGYSAYRDARLRRLTRYRYNNVPADYGGRYLYLRDDATGEYWSPSWQPVRRDLDSYECRHGLSYTAISSSLGGISAQALYFVPPGETLEVWRLRVTNERAEAAEISAFSFVEFALWDAQDDATNFQRNYSTGEVEVDARRCHLPQDRVPGAAQPLRLLRLLRAGGRVRHPARGVPGRLPRVRRAARRAARGQRRLHRPRLVPVGSHHVRLTLAPGQTREVIFLLGYSENPRDAKFSAPGVINKSLVQPVIEHWLDPAAVEAGFAALQVAPGGRARRAPGGHPGRRHQPHGQHLERLPVPGDLQHEPLDVVL